jgi:hypothetical protein
MYCKYCGEKRSKKAKYCKKCGSALPKVGSLRRHRLSLAIAIPAAFLFVGYIMNSGCLSNYISVFPFVPTSPKTVTLNCNYAGKNLNVSFEGYGNYNEYYKNYNYDKKDDFIKNKQLASFVYVSPRDSSIKKLVSDIKNVASSNGYDNDQTLELAACFIQNIPYDTNKAETILSGDNGNSADTEQYPYQTLYSNKGICTDKTYLGSAVLKELGYGTSMMIFNEAQHMSLGVAAPANYGSFNSSYVYMEMTTLAAPGVIPSEIDLDNGFPSLFDRYIATLSANQDPSTINLDPSQSISNPALIIPVSGGRQYSRIMTVKTLWNNINIILINLVNKKVDLQTAYNNVGYWNRIQAQDYSDYLTEPSLTQRCYPLCYYYPYYHCDSNCYTTTNISKTLKYSTYQNAYRNYQNAINSYNKKVAEYNALIDQFNDQATILKSYEY